MRTQFASLLGDIGFLTFPEVLIVSFPAVLPINSLSYHIFEKLIGITNFRKSIDKVFININ